MKRSTVKIIVVLVLGLGLCLALLWLLDGGPSAVQAQGPDSYSTYTGAPGDDCGGRPPCYDHVHAAGIVALDRASDTALRSVTSAKRAKRLPAPRRQRRFTDVLRGGAGSSLR